MLEIANVQTSDRDNTTGYPVKLIAKKIPNKNI